MDRRQFMKTGSALAIASAAVKHPAVASVTGQIVLQNAALRWQLQRTEKGIRSTRFDNRLSGRQYALDVEDEFSLLFKSGERIEISGWESCITDDDHVAPEAERGMTQLYHLGKSGKDSWSAVRNLAGGRMGVQFGGYGWFRHEFQLPESAKGQDIVFVLGGYDQQEWNEYWVHVNGNQIGHRTAQGRWRTPGQYTMRPGDPMYDSLHFGSQGSNLLAVRTRGYDFAFDGIPTLVLRKVVFHPWLFDQFISIGNPYVRISSFDLRETHQESPEKVQFALHNAEHKVSVNAHYELDGFTRRKWLEVINDDDRAHVLLDIEVENFRVGCERTSGGHGEPIFLEDDAFLGLEHPAGINQSSPEIGSTGQRVAGSIRLWHCPGSSIPSGHSMRSQVSLLGVSRPGESVDQFHRYVISRSPRVRSKHISLYTCYGINNQWGGCPALTDVEVLDSQAVVGKWQAKGVKFDYFTLDQGWPSNDGDLTEFVDGCYPDGPQRMVKGLEALGMKFGLWFSVSGGPWSDGSYPAVQTSAIPLPGATGEPPTTPPEPAYRNGFPTGGGIGRDLCIASDTYFNVFRNALQHHVHDNDLKLVKFDIGTYYCNSTTHQHLPGKYSSEAMFNRLIALADMTRAISPEMFVIWYWGVGASPFWGFYGDAIFESGLFLEGSGTSYVPSLYYRDSVTLALDQSTRFAKYIPPLLKDSLGVWISQIRWANFMGKHRWREALVMDMGRGNLIFPQLWGDPNLLDGEDQEFLAKMMALTRENEALLMRPRHDLGDIWKNEVYAYAFFEGNRGFVFCNNVHFTARKIQLSLGKDIGLLVPKGTVLQISSHFPERAEIQSEDGAGFKAGTKADIWLRPFETLLLEVSAAGSGRLPNRPIDARNADQFGTALLLKEGSSDTQLKLKFADAPRLEKNGLRPNSRFFTSELPQFQQRSVLAIHVALSKGGDEYRYSPYVAELVQLRVRLAGRELQLDPVPDARQYGNTQNAGCSWVVYQIPLSDHHAGENIKFAVHTYLPEGVIAATQAWLVKQWWRLDTRPEADGYYGDAPS